METQLRGPGEGIANTYAAVFHLGHEEYSAELRLVEDKDKITTLRHWWTSVHTLVWQIIFYQYYPKRCDQRAQPWMH